MEFVPQLLMKVNYKLLLMSAYSVSTEWYSQEKSYDSISGNFVVLATRDIYICLWDTYHHFVDRHLENNSAYQN